MAGAAANLPKWQTSKSCAKEILFSTVFFPFDKPITYGRTVAHKGEKTMLKDFEEVNRILAEMRDEGTVEPIDDPNIQVDFWDWADIIGVVDDYAPSEMVDEDGETWLVS